MMGDDITIVEAQPVVEPEPQEPEPEKPQPDEPDEDEDDTA